MPLEVTVKDPTSTSQRTLTFSKSPVRIGRNQLNDIPLDDPFVSEWHGLIHFAAESVDYYDLGSTNGTVLDGKRLAKNVPAPLTERSRIHLGRIEVTVVNRRAATETGPRKTMAWGHSEGTDPFAPARVRSPSRPLQPLGEGFRPQPLANTPPPERGTVDQTSEANALIRRQKILEAFSEAFVGLRKGYEQFGAEVGVRTINGRTPLHRARSSREDPRSPAGAQRGRGDGHARPDRHLRRLRHSPHRHDGSRHRGRARAAAVAGPARQRSGRRVAACSRPARPRATGRPISSGSTRH